MAPLTPSLAYTYSAAFGLGSPSNAVPLSQKPETRSFRKKLRKKPVVTGSSTSSNAYAEADPWGVHYAL